MHFSAPVAEPGLADSPADDADAAQPMLRGPTLEPVDESDPAQARVDPAASVVGIGEIPALERPVRRRRLSLPPMPQDATRSWVITILITLIGALVRFWDLGRYSDGGTPLFDGKYYAVEAAEMLRNGGVEDNQAYGFIVHPPLGKQLMAIGQWLFGYNPFGWRFVTAIAGTICILLIIRVTRRLTRSTLLGAIAGVLLICDSVSHVMARDALLDVFQELFILAAFCCLIADRDQVRARLAEAVADGSMLAHRAGVALGARWWRFGCGFLIGLAVSVKWSGIYWAAFFGVLTVVWDITARREYGVPRPILAVIRRDLLPNLWAYAVVPIATYIGSWWAWFGSENAYPRHIFVAAAGTAGDWQSHFLYWLAARWHNALWQWTWKMLDFHVHLYTPINPADRHPWESKPWSWPMGTRPLLMYAPANTPGCGGECAQRILLVGIPALWWLSLFVLAWALWRAIGRLDWRYAAVMVGYSAGYLPWFSDLRRQMYFFYVTPLAPFLVIGVTLVLGDILGRGSVPAKDGAPRGPVMGIERKYLSMAIVALYVGLVVANFIWLWPMLNGDPMSTARLTMETWLPSWG